MVYGTVAAYGVASPAQKHFGGSSKEIPGIGEIGYIGLTAFVLNVVVTVVLTLVLRAVKAPDGVDETKPEDYTADAGDPGVQVELPPATAGATHCDRLRGLAQTDSTHRTPHRPRACPVFRSRVRRS